MTRPQPPAPPFPPETLQRFFAAVEVNDAIGPAGALPASIAQPCSDAELTACYALCLQFWTDGVERCALLQLAHRLFMRQTLSAADQRVYKHMRARYKQLRFAQRLYTRAHREDALFGLTTVVLGHLQDAFRNGSRRATLAWSLALRVLLARPLWARVRRRVTGAALDTAAGLAAHRAAHMQRLRAALAHAEFTGPEFHALRKIVSQQVSYYDTLRTLRPDADLDAIARFLAAINGLMGARHDAMVADDLRGARPYATPAPLGADIRARLETLVAQYGAM